MKVMLLMAMQLYSLAAWAQGEVMVPGAEDGYFSAEDYRRLKAGRSGGDSEDDGEHRRVIRTDHGVIIIRRQDRVDSETGETRYQVRETRTGRVSGGVMRRRGE